MHWLILATQKEILLILFIDVLDEEILLEFLSSSCEKKFEQIHKENENKELWQSLSNFGQFVN